MTPKKAQHQSVIDAPKQSGNHTLHPATFGLLEWLQGKRKNPLLVGGTAELKHAGELCFAFTLPSAEVCAIPDAKLSGRIQDFMHSLTPAEFHRIQKHAEGELLKFQKTAVVPKKKATPPRQKVKR
ncbi:MAG: hypothetical protein RLZZ214_1956 [Verrucomicrobiota bacterium]|jgi:hypothetical protein